MAAHIMNQESNSDKLKKIQFSISASKSLRNLYTQQLLHYSLQEFKCFASDVTCNEMLSAAEYVEPEVRSMYLNFINSQTDPKYWVHHMRTLLLIQAEVDIDTFFVQVGVQQPSTIMGRAALYTYMQAIYSDYQREVIQFEGR